MPHATVVGDEMPLGPATGLEEPYTKQMLLLKKARDAASFKTHDMTCLIYGGADVVEKRRTAFARVEKLKGTSDTTKLPKLYADSGRESTYIQGLKCGKADLEEEMNRGHGFFGNTTSVYSLANSSPFGMTAPMFVPTIQLQGTKEQQERWIPPAKAGRIIGAYCQTELGHGSFVRGIETTATWDSDIDEFVIDSPTVSSTKFWPGALGYSCTHAVVMARLLIRSKDYGPHLFVVQLRSLVDGTPSPGIELGDLGPKMSYNTTDNGYAIFTNVRIPRTDMLMGNARVSADGTYTTSSHAKSTYATMLMVRNIVINAVGFQLAQAVTIATRYSTVREQGLGPNGLGNEESSIMAYKSQHFRLLTLLSKSYAILFSSRTSEAAYKILRAKQVQEDHSLLPYTHQLTAGLKAWTTQTAADGAEDARKCCGGQGYLAISGLPEIVGSVTASVTFEGEAYVLWQQVGRYLFKCIDRLQAQKTIDEGMAYMAHGYNHLLSNGTANCVRITSSPCDARGVEFLRPEVQLAIYRHRALRMAFAAYTAVRLSSSSPMEAWNEHMMSIIGAARAHIEYTVLESFIDQIDALPATTPTAVKVVLSRLRSLFALSTIINPQSIDAISFIEDGNLSLSQLNTIRALVKDLLEELLPDAVTLCDAWDFTDASLSSALGMKDGNVYANTMNWVRQLPINVNSWTKHKGVFQPGWKDWIKPTLKGGVRSRL